MTWLLLLLVLVAAVPGVLAWRKVRRQGLDRWIGTYVREIRRRRPPEPGRPIHVLICIADHFEPKVKRPPASVARARVARWLREYPQRFGGFRDSDGRPPRHTFFYPPEEYDREYLDMLSELCGQGYGEVEVHIHHHNDTAENFRRTLLDYKHLLADRHGLLSRHPKTGEVTYGFIHGNWSLCNSRRDGCWCGVNEELRILHETGCYADFTLPSAPSDTQIGKINSIYHAWDRPGESRSHEYGMDVGTGVPPEDALLMIQGPLVLDWKRRRRGVVPRLENGCLQWNQPPTMERLDLWLQARVQVATQPDWYFVKLHTHGAPEWNADMLLGEPMLRFHEGLARRAEEDASFHYHYVTAREMSELAQGASRVREQGSTGGLIKICQVADAFSF